LKNASGLSCDSKIHKDALEHYFSDDNHLESSGNATITTAGDVLAISRRSNRVKSRTEKKKFEEKQLRDFHMMSGVAGKLEKKFLSKKQRRNTAKRKLVSTKQASSKMVLRSKIMNDTISSIVDSCDTIATKQGLCEAHWTTTHRKEVNGVSLAPGDSAPRLGSAANTRSVLSQIKASPGSNLGSTKRKFFPNTSGGDNKLQTNANISDIESIIKPASPTAEWQKLAMDGGIRSSARAVARRRNDKEAEAAPELSAHKVISRAAKRQKPAVDDGFSSCKRSLTTGRKDIVPLEAPILTANNNNISHTAAHREELASEGIGVSACSKPETPLTLEQKRIYYMQKKVVVTTNVLGLIVNATGEKVIVTKVKKIPTYRARLESETC
jgi:hypothetical protein